MPVIQSVAISKLCGLEKGKGRVWMDVMLSNALGQRAGMQGEAEASPVFGDPISVRW